MADDNNSLDSGSQNFADYDSSLETEVTPSLVTPTAPTEPQVPGQAVPSSPVQPVPSPVAQPEPVDPSPKGLKRLFRKRPRKVPFLVNGFVLALIATIGIGSFLLSKHSEPPKAPTSTQASNYATTSLPVGNVHASESLQVGQANQLAINGQVTVGNTLVITPTATPTSPTAGQIYYSQATNTPYYYNGKQFVSLGGSTSTAQPQLQAGNGIAVSGGTVTNSGVVSLSAGTTNLSLSQNGAGGYTISDSSLTGSGTTGQIALFSGSQALGDSILSQSGTSLSAAGDLAVQGTATTNELNVTTSASAGSLNVTNLASLGSLNVASGDLTVDTSGNLATSGNLTVDGSVATNTLTQNTTGNLNVGSLSAGNSLTFNSGGRSFTLNTSGASLQTICTTDVNGVTCATGGGDAVLLQTNIIQNDSGSGSSVWINNTGGGNLLELEGNGTDHFVVDNAGNVTASGSLQVKSSSGLTIGVPGSTAGSLKLANTTNTNQTILQAAAPTGSGNATITIPSIAGGTSDTICLKTLKNCSASGPAGGDLTGTYPNPTIAALQGNTLTITSPSSGQVLQYNGSAFVNGLLTNTNLTSGAYSNITGTGALASGSIASGFGTISTGNNITTTATVQGAAITGTGQLQAQSLLIDGGAFTVSGAGAIAGAKGITSSGTITFSGLSSAGIVTNTAGGQLGTVSSIGVANGGTGAASLTANGILYGNGTSAIQATASANNSVLVTDGSGNPSLSTTLPTAVQGNITSTGALASGSIAVGFGTISTHNNITTTTTVQGATVTATGALQGASLSVDGGAFAVNASGAISAATGITSSGTITFSGLSSAGIVTNTAGGQLGTVSSIGVANGGTGAASLTANGILYGNGTSAIQATASANNSVLVTDGSGNPSLSTTLPTAVQGNITSTGALASGSIAVGFGTISTHNNITTTTTVQGATVTATGALQGNTLNINSNTLAISSAGAITTTGTYNTDTLSSSQLLFGASSTATIDSASGQTLQVGTSANAHNITIGNTSGNTTLTLQAGTGGIILGPNGSTPLLDADSTDSVIGIGTVPTIGGSILQVGGAISSTTNLSVGTGAGLTTLSQTALVIGGTTVCTVSGCGPAPGLNYIANQSGGSPQSANFNIQSAASSSIGAVIEGTGSSGVNTQTADLLDLDSGAGTKVAYFDASGDFTNTGNISTGGNLGVTGTTTLTGNLTASGSATFADTASSGTAFQIQNTSGSSLLNVNNTTVNPAVTVGSGQVSGIPVSATSSPSTGAGSAPTGLATGNFCNNGLADLITANQAASTASLFCNSGNALPNSVSGTLATGTNAYAVAGGNFCNNGLTDAVVTDQSNNVLLFCNTGSTGSAAFGGSASNTLTDTVGPQTVTVGNLCNNGRADIAVSNSSNIYLFCNNGTTGSSGGLPTSVSKTITGGSGGPDNVTVGNFCNNGRTDLAASNNAGSVSIYCNTGSTGSAAFSGSVSNTLTGGSSLWGITGGNFCNNGRTDLATVDLFNNAVYLYCNNGTTGSGSLPTSASATLTDNKSPIGVVTGNFCNNGRTDLATSNQANNSASIYCNNGTTGSGGGLPTNPNSLSTTGSSPEFPAAADFNGDGRTDLAVANFSSGNVSVYLNNGGNPTFAVLNSSVATNTSGIVQIQGNALTTGYAENITFTSNTLTSGALLNLTDNAATTATGGLLQLQGNALTSGVGINVTTGASTTGSGIRVTSTAASSLSSGGGLLVLTGNSATTATGGLLQVAANALTTGYAEKITATGVVLSSGGLLKLTDNSATTATGGLLQVQGNALTSGVGINVTTGASTSGTGIKVTSTATTSLSSGGGLLVLTGNSATTATGGLLQVQGNALTTGYAANLTSTSSAISTGGLLALTDNSATTATGGLLQINGTSLSSTGVALNINALGSSTGLAVNSGSIINLGAGTGNTSILDIPQDNIGSDCASGTHEGIEIKKSGGTQVGHICINGATAGVAPGGLEYYATAFNASSTDEAENYSDANNNLSPGDLVALAPNSPDNDAIVAATPGNQNTVIGTISTSPGILLSGISESDGSTDLTNPKPVALSGRVPVNVTTENGPIEPGDYLTLSATTPGYAMKATSPGNVVGKALAAYTSSTPGQVMMLVDNTYYAGPTQTSYIQNGGNATLDSLTVGGSADFSDLNASGNTTLNNLTVTGSATIASLTVTGSAQFDGNITVAGHIITAGGQPTANPQTAAGTEAQVTVSGTDTIGTITITTGSNPTAGALADILFSKAYTQAPHVVLSPSDNSAADLHRFTGTTTTNDFSLNVAGTPAPDTTYQYDYFVVTP